jgi:hypothetical protein
MNGADGIDRMHSTDRMARMNRMNGRAGEQQSRTWRAVGREEAAMTARHEHYRGLPTPSLQRVQSTTSFILSILSIQFVVSRHVSLR